MQKYTYSIFTEGWVIVKFISQVLALFSLMILAGYAFTIAGHLYIEAEFKFQNNFSVDGLKYIPGVSYELFLDCDKTANGGWVDKSQYANNYYCNERSTKQTIVHSGFLKKSWIITTGESGLSTERHMVD